jgi:ribonuclease T1
MRLKIPLLVLLVAVAVLLTQVPYTPLDPGQRAAGLPPEAIETLRLIEHGGPFPHRQDGTMFQNRERLLPDRARGYYREYTVRTPGARDRGARRIVTGGDPPHVFYYTEDHYRSFREIEAPR